MDLEELQQRRQKIVSEMEEDRLKWRTAKTALSASISHAMFQLSVFSLALVDMMIEATVQKEGAPEKRN